MKIKWILAFVFCTIFPALRPLSVFADDLLPKGSHIDFYTDSDVYGGKIVLPSAELRFYENTQSEASNFGFYWHAEKVFKTLPWSIKAGNLTPTGLYSKMKNPLLSSSLSPFSSVPSEATWLTASLPSYSTFSRTSSYYLQCGYSNSKAVLRELLISYWDSQAEDIQALSAKIKISPFKKLSIAMSGCSGYFDFGTNYSNSWFSDDLFYHDGTHFCGITQMSVSLLNFSSLFTLGLFQSPFGTFENLYKLESKYKSSHFIFTFSGVYVPNEILTSNDTAEKQLLQLKGGIQYKYITGNKIPVCVKTGFSTLAKAYLYEEDCNLKFACGVQLSSSLLSLTGTTQINTTLTIPQAGTSQLLFKSGELKLKNTWYIQSFCPSFSVSKSYTPSTDYTSLSTTSSCEFDYSFTDNPRITDKYKVSITEKNNIPAKRTFTNSISIQTRIKQISCTGNFSMSMEF